MKLTEARVGLVAIALAVAGHGVLMWADVRENTRVIAFLKTTDVRQDAERAEAQKAIRDFLREYERKEAEDQAVNVDVERLQRAVDDLRVEVARMHRHGD